MMLVFLPGRESVMVAQCNNSLIILNNSLILQLENLQEKHIF